MTTTKIKEHETWRKIGINSFIGGIDPEEVFVIAELWKRNLLPASATNYLFEGSNAELPQNRILASLQKVFKFTTKFIKTAIGKDEFPSIEMVKLPWNEGKRLILASSHLSKLIPLHEIGLDECYFEIPWRLAIELHDELVGKKELLPERIIIPYSISKEGRNFFKVMILDIVNDKWNPIRISFY